MSSSIPVYGTKSLLTECCWFGRGKLILPPLGYHLRNYKKKPKLVYIIWKEKYILNDILYLETS